ncbi:MAG: polyphosphate--glucose phosphotransferase [Planctomycetota bacterium JB042]
MDVLGIDIGGSGIKGAIVDTATGTLKTERHRIETPKPATPDAVAETVGAVAQHFDWRGPIGCGFPAVIHAGVARTANNVDDAFIGTDVAALLRRTTRCPVRLLNDADAAGLAEIAFGAGKRVAGVVLLITVGTGIGSALFTDGRLVPNTEFGQVMVGDRTAERYASDATRKRKDLRWEEWAERFSKVLDRLDALVSPDLFVLGGGAAKKMHKFEHALTGEFPLVPAAALNQAGIVGAACAAADGGAA